MIDGLCQQTNILTTILDMVGIETPLLVQGKFLKDVIVNDSIDTGDEWAYIESVSSGAYALDYIPKNQRPAYGKIDNPVDTFTIRNHEFRFTYFTNMKTGELFDLKKRVLLKNQWVNPGRNY